MESVYFNGHLAVPLRHTPKEGNTCKRFLSPVDSACDRALVRKHTRYSPLVFGGGTSDERRVVDDTILGGVALGLERPEESLKDIGNARESKLVKLIPALYHTIGRTARKATSSSHTSYVDQRRAGYAHEVYKGTHLLSAEDLHR